MTAAPATPHPPVLAWRQLLLICILTLALTLLLSRAGVFDRLEAASFDHRVQWYRGAMPLHPDIEVFLIDEQSLQQLQGRFGRWPWPRSAYRDLLAFFQLARVKTVAMDILFSERQRADGAPGMVDDDRILIEATREAGNVVHAMQLTELAGNRQNRDLPVDFIERFRVEGLDFDGRDYSDYLIPFDGLYQAARAVGNLEIEPDADGIYRRIRLFNGYRGDVFPSMAMAVALPLIAGEETLVYHPGEFRFADTVLSLDVQGRYLINPLGDIRFQPVVRVFEAMARIRAGLAPPPELDPARLEGKIVFIGASAVSLNDVKPTAISPREPGVFIHATVLSNFLQQDFLTRVEGIAEYALWLSFALLGALPVLLAGRLWPALLVVTLAALCYLASSYLALAWNLVMPLVGVLFILFLAHFFALMFRLVRERRHKQRVRQLLGQYVSPHVLDELMSQYDDRLEGTGRTECLSILFSDIRGFTCLSEQRDARQVVDLLNIYFSQMTEIILQRRGTLNKFIGDAILAFWGAPLEAEDHADQAVLAAIAMRRELPGVNRRLTQAGHPSIDIGIGIHSGDVVLGNIGSSRKLEYTIIGDAVNLASRTEGLTKLYGVSILLTEDTRRAMRISLPCLVVDKVMAKGKRQPVLLFTPAELFVEEQQLQMPMDDVLELVETGFGLYQSRQWGSAVETLQPLRETRLAGVLIERCRAYARKEPEEDWNGAYQQISK